MNKGLIKTKNINDHILDNLTENIVITDLDLNITQCLGNLFTSEKLTEEMVKKMLQSGKHFITTKFSENGNQNLKFNFDFNLNDEVINAKIRVLRFPDSNQIAFYIKDRSKPKAFRKDIIKKFLSIEKLSRSRKIREGKLDKAIYEILELSSKATGVERINAWLISEDHNEIHCLGNFDLRVNRFEPQAKLPRIAIPNYFKLFETKKIIVTNDTFNDQQTIELLDMYLKPNDIRAMMDIPIRIEGEMVGVVCFEHTGSAHVWTMLEQKFGFVISQIISLAIETQTKIQTQKDLEHAVNEQRILLQEVHHRVKNNLAIVSSLINLQSDKAKDNYHKLLFEECRNRLNSIATIHQMLYKSKSFSKINFKDYLSEIVNNLYDSYGSGEKEIIITKNLEDIYLELSQAVPLSLIVNEVITNAFKHAFKDRKKGTIHIDLFNGDSKNRKLIIKDDGPGFKKEKKSEISLGMDIIEGLVEQIEGKHSFESKNGAIFKLLF